MSDKENKAELQKFNAEGYKVGIVQALFNSVYTEPMLAEAQKTLAEYGVLRENTKILKVAGSIEAPRALQALAEKEFDCLIVLGVIIKGQTAHFDYVAKTVTDGALRVSLDYKIPVGFGVITAFTEEQAEARIYHGGEAVKAVLNLAREIKDL